MLLKPLREAAQVFSKGREAFGLIGCEIFQVGFGNGCDDKRFVDVDATADEMNNFEHKHRPSGLNLWFRRQGLSTRIKQGSRLKMISLRGRCHTYLYLKGLAAYIIIRTSRGRRTHLPVL